MLQLNFKKITIALLVVFVAFSAVSCGGDTKSKKNYLIKAGEVTATKQDFEQFWEIYVMPYYANSDTLTKEEISQTKQDAFDQLIITLLMEARAQDLGISVSEEELDSEMIKLTDGYSQSVLKETMVKAAVPFNIWREGLRRRILMEKLMSLDLYSYGEITPDDVVRYGEASGGDKDDPNEVLGRVYRAKAENDFKSWTRRLQENYPIDINYEEWADILSE